tara:strand:- start:1570 stop:3438 length:1869 start_codon:yes stop_codon:yes gene_type:complete
MQNTYLQKLLCLEPFQRRSLLIVADIILFFLSVLFCFWLQVDNSLEPNLTSSYYWIPQIILLIGIPFYFFSGQYKSLTRYVGSWALYQLALRNAFLVLLLMVAGLSLHLPMPATKTWLLMWILLTVLTGAARFGMRDALLRIQSKPSHTFKRIAIYGAGYAGVQLLAALRLANSHSVEMFVDDNPDLWQRSVNDVPINPPQVLFQQVGLIDQVFLAIPSLSRLRRRQIVKIMEEAGIYVLQVPSVEEIANGYARIDSLRQIQVEDLLGRDPVPSDTTLLGPGVTDASICVTGAGGSIGAELCRQIVTLNPRRLVLFERSEPSLYLIHKELLELDLDNIEVVPLLGSATNSALVDRCFKEHEVEVVFHAAAYKHVPLVEANPLAGLSNNVRSTRVVCEAARRFGLRKFVLISTDKAVRPTNVMGASKRLAELVVQSQPKGVTSFAMVRFGNVLGSSGSVVPLFRRQIALGGPITLTHPEIIRYFMTIKEAAQLVLQSAVLAQSGDLFLLDMGEPVRIKALAEQMVRLSGLSVKDATNPDGDIEIVCTGLRPGEKLYEELLIDAESVPTSHPLIFRANERFLQANQLWPELDSLEEAIKDQNLPTALSIVHSLVPEWKSSQSKM